MAGIETINSRLISGIKGYFQEASREKAVLGLSGGIDSALVASLLAEALGKENVTALIMPLEGISNHENTRDAEEFAKQLGIKVIRLPINAFKSPLDKLPWVQAKVASANANARIRALLLYNYANSNNCLVVGTGNKTEMLLGYFTKFGDGAEDFFVIGDLYKKEVRELSRKRGIPAKFVEKAPSADLWQGQTDEGELGLTYAEMDKILVAIENGSEAKLSENGISADKIALVNKRVAANRHKSLPTPRIKLH